MGTILISVGLKMHTLNLECLRIWVYELLGFLVS